MEIDIDVLKTQATIMRQNFPHKRAAEEEEKRDIKQSKEVISLIEIEVNRNV